MYVDNKCIGKTPLLLDFLVGSHEISIRKEGYHIERRKVEINENEQIKVDVNLSDVIDLSLVRQAATIARTANPFVVSKNNF